MQSIILTLERETLFSEADKTISQSLELTSILYHTSNDLFEVLEPEVEHE